MSETYEISFQTNYKNTDFTRKYTLSDVDSISAAVETIRSKVNAINTSLAGGQASTLANLFVADDYDSSEDIGTLEKISNLKLKAVTEIDIPKPLTRTANPVENKTENESEETENVDDNFNQYNDDQR